MTQTREYSPYGGDWLDVDLSELPTNQLPLLRSMLGRGLVNIHRSIMNLEFELAQVEKGQNFFRKAFGETIFEMEGLPFIYFDDCKYNRHEISIRVSSNPPHRFGAEQHGLARRYTLKDGEHVDDRLRQLPGRRILKMSILIRRPDLPRDKAQALQDGIAMAFDNGTTVIVSYYLNQLQGREFQLLYPEEIPWQAVEYTVDVAKGNISWIYRFNRWKWRALDRLTRRFDLH
jgi:hypothetical protein